MESAGVQPGCGTRRSPGSATAQTCSYRGLERGKITAAKHATPPKRKTLVSARREAQPRSRRRTRGGSCAAAEEARWACAAAERAGGGRGGGRPGSRAVRARLEAAGPGAPHRGG